MAEMGSQADSATPGSKQVSAARHLAVVLGGRVEREINRGLLRRETPATQVPDLCRPGVLENLAGRKVKNLADGRIRFSFDCGKSHRTAWLLRRRIAITPKWRAFHVHCFESHRHESRAAQRSSLIAGFPLRLGGLGGALEQAGVPLVAIQQYLGHADMAMTMRYSHLSPAARQDYIKVLDGAR